MELYTSGSDGWPTASEDKSIGSNLSKNGIKPAKSCGYLAQGAGGVYTLPKSLLCMEPDSSEPLPDTAAICTTGCLTCVGVYIPLSSTKYFAAHFDARLFNHPSPQKISIWQIPMSLIPSFKTAVEESLEKKFQDMQQTLESVRNDQKLRDRAIIVCTWPDVGGLPGPGSHIIDVLCSYFNLDKAVVVDRYTAHHGFIVDHRNDAQPQLLGWTCPGPTSTVLDQIADLAENCVSREFDENFRGVFRTTYQYVFPDPMSWEIGRIKGEEEKRPFELDYDFKDAKKGWRIGD